MPALTSRTARDPSAAGVREAQRLETRARLFAAAVAEIGRAGLAGADVSAIAAAVGVVRGTFYFHFPTKEHVVVELERIEETRIAEKLGATDPARGLAAILSDLVDHVLEAEHRLGPVVFRDMLGLHFSSTRPVDDGIGEHPLAEFVVAAVARAQSAGRVAPQSDPRELAVIFMTGLFALLATLPPETRAAMLNRYVTTIVQGMESP